MIMRSSKIIRISGSISFPVYRETPGDEPTNDLTALTPTSSSHISIDTNDFHIAHAHTHEGALKTTAKKMGANLGGEMHECKGYSIAKGFCVSIPKNTDNRAVKMLPRVFVDLGRKRRVASNG